MNTKRLLRVAVFGLFLISQAHAALVDRGSGMIYDTTLQITWLQDASQGGNVTWNDAVAWASNLSFGGFDDWRLPSMDVDGDQGNIFGEGIVDCTTATELECRDNELGYMFYQNLMGSSGDILTGTQGFIQNLQIVHWSSMVLTIDLGDAWALFFLGGVQGTGDMNLVRGAWAVRDGDVVPLPAGVWLLGSGLLMMVGAVRRRR